MFQGLNELYSLDLQGNRLDTVEPFGFANLPALRHLDIRFFRQIPSLDYYRAITFKSHFSYNQLQTMPINSFENSFEPVPNDRRVIYACGRWQSVEDW
jgi:hypothetical protein